jgi:hypothetical protein
VTTPGLTVTAFPVAGENARAQDGKVRGVDQVLVQPDSTIKVIYIDGYEELYEPTHIQEVNTR